MKLLKLRLKPRLLTKLWKVLLAVFTLSVTPAQNAVSADQTLDVQFNVTQEGNFILWRYKRSINMNSAMATLEIKTHDDEVDEDTGDITVTLVDTVGYDIPASQGNSASITVMDDDDPPTDGSPPPDSRGSDISSTISGKSAC